MNIKKVAVAFATSRQKGLLEGEKLFLITPTGIISGCPILQGDSSSPLLKDPSIKILSSMFSADPDSKAIVGDDSVFLLCQATVRQGVHTTDFPYLFVRFDSVIGFSFGH